MKKIVLLFLGAITSFFILAYVDEYENLMAPFFGSSNAERPLFNFGGPSEDNVKKVIINFNKNLRNAYLSSNPDVLVADGLDNKLRAYLSSDIRYLRGEGRIMEFNLEGIEIEKVDAISPFFVQVKTKEMVRLRYLSISSRKELAAFPAVEYRMQYALSASTAGWIITSHETLSVNKPQLLSQIH